MLIKKHQHGVGLVEILVSLVILSIGILGYVALQVRALEASVEAGNNIQAMNIARDLAERMRMNRDGLEDYKNPTLTADDLEACETNYCDATALAKFDYGQVKQQAADRGMALSVLNCPESTLSRLCVYVAWDDTQPTNSTEEDACTNGVAYHPRAKCIIMEALND